MTNEKLTVLTGGALVRIPDERLTKLTGSMLAAVRDQVECLIDRGDVDSASIKVMLNREAKLLAVAALAAEGKTPKQIHKRLGVGLSTVYEDLAFLARKNRQENTNENKDADFLDQKNPVIDADPPPADPPSEHLSPLDQTREDARVEAEAKNEELANVEVLAPIKTYETIVMDAPWPMTKIERDVRPNQVAFDYPTMSVEELRDFSPKLNKMAADHCHLFLWTTQKYLPTALELVEHYGFRYVLTMVWHKAGGYQPTGLPQFNCEFVIYARKGTPKFVTTQGFFCCLNGARREHSRKPDEFYDLIKLVTNGPCIDVFSREQREGFDQYGNEVAAFGTAAE